MADFTDIVLFLSSGRAVAWIGAGPSIEMGLPTWKDLAREVLERCRRERKNNFRRIEQLYQEGEYTEQFEEVALRYGREFLHDVCRRRFIDPGITGSIYTELVKLDFLSYFTTNYDDLLIRHLKSSGKAVQVYRNSQEDLEAVDIDTTPSLVKLHGDFSDPNSVVLTKSDYQRMYGSGEHESFQTFLRSHLARDRILFVGYSLKDPEILQIQERLASNFRSDVAPIALLSNVHDDDIEYWKRTYNIDVVPYGSDHTGLLSLLQSVSNVISVGKFAQHRIPEQDLRKAQALYMWFRFTPSTTTDAPIDALQSIIMASLSMQGGKASLEELANTIKDNVGVEIEGMGTDLTDAINQLTERKLVTSANQTIQMLPEGKQLVDRYDRRFSDMMEVFRAQLSFDLMRDISIDELYARELAQVVLEALIDFFELRGREIMSMMFDDEPISRSSVTELLRTIWLRANSIDDLTSRPLIVEFVLRTLLDPTGIYKQVLDYLSRSFFCIQAMGRDPNVKRYVHEVASDRTLIIDDNVLIPLTAKYEDRHQFVSEGIRAARNAGLTLCTTRRFVDAVRRHADWALDLIKSNGTQSVEVMRAAQGEDRYAPNAFLKGYIDQDPDDHDREFLQYLRDCFGGSYARDSFDVFFEDHLNIRILDTKELAAFIQSKQDLHDQADTLMKQWNTSRSVDAKKSPSRIASEIETLLLISDWDNASKCLSKLTNSRVSFVTSGSSIPRLFKEMKLSSGRMTVMNIEAISGFLTRLEPSQDSRSTDFRSMMLASHFRLASHFVRPENYRRFFRPLIATAKNEFEEYRDLFEETLGTELGDAFLNDLEDVKWPSTVSGLQQATVRKVTDQGRGYENLLSENEKLRSMLADYQERERKRREYRTRQRREQRLRSQRK